MNAKQQEANDNEDHREPRQMLVRKVLNTFEVEGE